MATTQNEYLVPVGIDLGPFVSQLREATGGMTTLKDAAQKSSTVLTDTFKKSTQAQKDFVAQIVQANKAAKQQVDQASTLANVLSTLSGKLSGSKSSGLKALADDLNKISEQSKKLGAISIPVNDTELAALEAILGNVTDEFQALGKVIDFMKVKLQQLDPNTDEFKVLSEQLAIGEKVLADFGGAADDVGEKSKSLKSQLRTLKEELAVLEDAGKTQTQEFEDKAIAAAKLEDQLGDTAQRIRALASDTKFIDAGIQAVQGIASAYSVAQGAQALFGAENEDLQKTMVKLTAVMSILQGLQQLQIILQEQSTVAVVANTIATKAAAAAQAIWTFAIGSSTGALRVLRIALFATGIGAIVALVGLAIEAFSSWTSSTEDQAEALAKLKEEQEAYNEALTREIDAQEKVRNARAGGLDDLNRQLKVYEAQGASEEVLFTKRQQILEAEIANAKARRNSYTKDIEAQSENYIAAQKLINDKETELLALRLEYEKNNKNKRADAQKKRQEEYLNNEKRFYELLAEIQQKFAQANVELIQDQEQKDIASENLRFTSEIASLRKQLAEFKGTAAQKAILAQESNKLIERLTQVHNLKLIEIEAGYNAQRAEILKTTGNAVAEVIGDQQDREIAAINDKYQKLFDDLSKIKPKTNKDKNNFYRLFLGLDQAQEKEINDVIQKFSLQTLETQKELALKTVDLIKLSGLSESDQTAIKEGQKLDIIKNFAKQQFDVIADSLTKQGKLLAGDTADLLNLDNFNKAAKQGTDIFTYLGIKIDDLETKKKLLDLIEQINSVKQAAKAEENDLSFFDRLRAKISDFLTDPENKFGLTKGDAQRVISGFENLFGNVIGLYSSLVDQQIAEKQRQVDALTSQIDKVEEELNRELEAQKNGYANNVGAKKQEIEELKKQRDKQLADERRLAKERAAIQSAQIAASTIEQTVDLGTAAAKIFKAHSSIPFVGVAIALAAVATMVAGFLSIRNTIKAAAQDVPKFRGGGEFDLFDTLAGAPSHESKGVGLYNEVTGKKLAEFEGDEQLYVVNKGKSKKHRKLLEAINKDDFSELSMNDGSVKSLLSQLGGSDFIQTEPKTIVIQQNRYFEQQSEEERAKRDQSQKHIDKMDELITEVRDFKQFQKNKKQVNDYGDYIEEKEGSRTKIIRKKKDHEK